MRYYIGCEPVFGGVVGVVPVLPPDNLADLSVLDGLPAKLRVEVDTGGKLLVFDATLTLSAPKDVTSIECYGAG